MDWDGQSRLTGQLRFHCFDNVVRHERLAVVLADVTVRGETGFAPEITGELATLIILDQDHVLAAPENGADLRRVQWHNPFDGELIGHDAFFACKFFHGFAAHGHIRKYDGEPFMPHHIVEAVKEQLGGKSRLSVPVHEVNA